MSDNIRVAIRIRPLIDREIKENAVSLWSIKENQTLYQTSSPSNSYQFDRVFGCGDGNEVVFKDLCQPVAKSVIQGFNGTIFAYGQTSSGKTYTMLGDDKTIGIIPYTIYNIFDEIKASPEREFLLRISYLEIYNEIVSDLLCTTVNGNLKIQEDSDGFTIIHNLREEIVKTAEEIFSFMQAGQKKMHIGMTSMNDRSSRSHTVFRMIIESRMRDTGINAAVSVSQLNFVDLAGSERCGRQTAVGEQFKEGVHINRSLLTLSHVICQLSEDNRQFINYRDSKLTRILKNSLGGNAHTVIICTVTPASLEQTLSTLKFASRAKKVINKPTPNIVMTEQALLKRYAKEIHTLSNKLKDLQEQNNKSNSKELLKQELEEQCKQNENLQKQIRELKEKFITAQFVINQTKLSKRERRKTWSAGSFPYVCLQPPSRPHYKSLGGFNKLPSLKEEEESLGTCNSVTDTFKAGSFVTETQTNCASKLYSLELCDHKSVNEAFIQTDVCGSYIDEIEQKLSATTQQVSYLNMAKKKIEEELSELQVFTTLEKQCFITENQQPEETKETRVQNLSMNQSLLTDSSLKELEVDNECNRSADPIVMENIILNNCANNENHIKSILSDSIIQLQETVNEKEANITNLKSLLAQTYAEINRLTLENEKIAEASLLNMVNHEVQTLLNNESADEIKFDKCIQVNITNFKVSNEIKGEVIDDNDNIHQVERSFLNEKLENLCFAESELIQSNILLEKEEISSHPIQQILHKKLTELLESASNFKNQLTVHESYFLNNFSDTSSTVLLENSGELQNALSKFLINKLSVLPEPLKNEENDLAVYNFVIKEIELFVEEKKKEIDATKKMSSFCSAEAEKLKEKMFLLLNEISTFQINAVSRAKCLEDVIQIADKFQKNFKSASNNGNEVPLMHCEKAYKTFLQACRDNKSESSLKETLMNDLISCKTCFASEHNATTHEKKEIFKTCHPLEENERNIKCQKSFFKSCENFVYRNPDAIENCDILFLKKNQLNIHSNEEKELTTCDKIPLINDYNKDFETASVEKNNENSVIVRYFIKMNEYLQSVKKTFEEEIKNLLAKQSLHSKGLNKMTDDLIKANILKVEELKEICLKYSFDIDKMETVNIKLDNLTASENITINDEVTNILFLLSQLKNAARVYQMLLKQFNIEKEITLLQYTKEKNNLNKKIYERDIDILDLKKKITDNEKVVSEKNFEIDTLQSSLIKLKKRNAELKNQLMSLKENIQKQYIFSDESLESIMSSESICKEFKAICQKYEPKFTELNACSRTNNNTCCQLANQPNHYSIFKKQLTTSNKFSQTEMHEIDELSRSKEEEKQIKKLLLEIEEIKSSHLKFQLQTEDDKKKLVQEYEKNVMLEKQIYSLNEKNKSYEKEIEQLQELKHKISDMNLAFEKQIEKVEKDVLDECSLEIKILKEKFSSEMSKREHNYQLEIDRLLKENQEKDIALVNHQDEISKLKKKHEETIRLYKSQTKEINKKLRLLKQKLNVKTEEYKSMSSKLATLSFDNTQKSPLAKCTSESLKRNLLKKNLREKIIEEINKTGGNLQELLFKKECEIQRLILNIDELQLQLNEALLAKNQAVAKCNEFEMKTEYLNCLVLEKEQLLKLQQLKVDECKNEVMKEMHSVYSQLKAELKNKEIELKFLRKQLKNESRRKSKLLVNEKNENSQADSLFSGQSSTSYCSSNHEGKDTRITSEVKCSGNFNLPRHRLRIKTLQDENFLLRKKLSILRTNQKRLHQHQNTAKTKEQKNHAVQECS